VSGTEHCPCAKFQPNRSAASQQILPKQTDSKLNILSTIGEIKPMSKQSMKAVHRVAAVDRVAAVRRVVSVDGMND